MLKDWKTTVTGIALATLMVALVIAVLVTRPEWGTAEIVLLVGGVGTALGTLVLGVVARDPAKAAPTVPPIVGALLLGVGIGLLVVAAPLSLAGCTPAVQATAAQVGGAALAAADGPACELVEVRSGSALAGVVCEMAAGALERYLASVGSTSQALTSSEARAAAPRCRLVPVRAAGAHQGFVCEEHAVALAAALARDGGA